MTVLFMDALGLSKQMEVELFGPQDVYYESFDHDSDTEFDSDYDSEDGDEEDDEEDYSVIESSLLSDNNKEDHERSRYFDESEGLRVSMEKNQRGIFDEYVDVDTSETDESTFSCSKKYLNAGNRASLISFRQQNPDGKEREHDTGVSRCEEDEKCEGDDGDSELVAIASVATVETGSSFGGIFPKQISNDDESQVPKVTENCQDDVYFEGRPAIRDISVLRSNENFVEILSKEQQDDIDNEVDLGFEIPAVLEQGDKTRNEDVQDALEMRPFNNNKAPPVPVPTQTPTKTENKNKAKNVRKESSGIASSAPLTPTPTLKIEEDKNTNKTKTKAQNIRKGFFSKNKASSSSGPALAPIAPKTEVKKSQNISIHKTKSSTTPSPSPTTSKTMKKSKAKKPLRTFFLFRKRPKEALKTSSKVITNQAEASIMDLGGYENLKNLTSPNKNLSEQQREVRKPKKVNTAAPKGKCQLEDDEREEDDIVVLHEKVTLKTNYQGQLIETTNLEELVLTIKKSDCQNGVLVASYGCEVVASGF